MRHWITSFQWLQNLPFIQDAVAGWKRARTPQGRARTRAVAFGGDFS